MQFKINKKDIFWSYLGQIFFSGINVVLLPFVLRLLSTQELGLWYTYTAVGALIMLLDFGLATTLTRYFAYSMSGASSIDNTGSPIFGQNESNIQLYKTVLLASKKIYMNIAIISMIITLFIGLPYMLYISKGEINQTNVVISWLFFSIAIVFNLMYAYWTPLLKGINEIKSYYQIMVLSKILQLIISIVLLFIGLNLLGISIAYLASSLSTRVFSMLFYKKSTVYKNIKDDFHSLTILPLQIKSIIKKIKKSIIKQGTISISYFINERSALLIVSAFYGLTLSAQFGLTVQIFSLISVFANVYYNTMIAPIISQKSKGKNIEAFMSIKKTLGIQVIIFTISSCFIVFFGNNLLAIISSNSFLLETNMLLLYIVYVLLFNYQTICSNFLVMDNRFFMLRPYVAFGLIQIMFELLLSIYFLKFGLYNILLTQLIILLLYNGWKWPSIIAKENDQKFLVMIVDSVRLGFIELLNLIKLGEKNERA